MTTSFRKATRGKVPDIIGTRISVENSQLLISTGAPDFDSVIGGGLAVGTVLLIAEDPSGSYAKLLAKLFLAEGIAVGHPLFVASRDLDPDKLVKEIPPTVTSSDSTKDKRTKGAQDEAQLKIAWRYQNLPTGGPDLPSSPLQFGHHFDLSRTLSPEAIEAAKITLWNGDTINAESPGDVPVPTSYDSLITSIQQCLTEQGCWVSGPGRPAPGADQPRRNVLRLVLHSLGSPCWGEGLQHNKLTTLLLTIRSLMRAACAVCLITVPAPLLEPEILSRCCHLSDYCIQPDPAHHIDGKVAPLLSGMDGVFRIIRLSAINCLAPFKPPTLDLGFKVRRKKFTIEKLQLPPELTESVEREQDDIGVPGGNLGCGSASSKRLEF